MPLGALVAFLILLAATPAAAHEVEIDTTAARAVVDAVANPRLTETEARRIAQLPANQMVVRKVRTFSENGTEDRFVTELLAIATGGRVEGQSLFRFERTLRDREGTLATLASIERDPAGFARWVDDRVEAFSPPGDPLRLKGFLVAAGGPTGFAFGGSEFYLNISHFPNDLEAARVVTAHELFHAVQGAAVTRAGTADRFRFREAQLAELTDAEARTAYLVDRYFYNLLTEGVAMYVGDPELLANNRGSYSKWDIQRLRTQQQNMSRWVIMLDMALIALTAPQPIDYRDAYALGFYGEDQPLYFLGYEMSEAIARRFGNRRLGELSVGSGCDFARAYLEAAASDTAAPQLAQRTQAMIRAACRA